MKKVIEILREIETGEVGIIIYSQKKQEVVATYNKEIEVPLASSAKIAIGFCVAKWIEEGHFKWHDIVENINFNPEENSTEVYPHFQKRKTLMLQEAIEVMIACHDNFVADSVVQFCGGWEKVNKQIKLYFNTINITQNPMNIHNSGELSQIHNLLCLIFQRYETSPELWTPIINGLVRQQDEIEGIPNHFLNHMTGGLEDVVVDIGIIGEFYQHPFLYVLGAKNLPNRYKNQFADKKIIEAMMLLYQEYLNQDT